MNQLTRFSMKNVTALFLIVLLLFGAGVVAATKLKVESMPDLTVGVVLVTTVYSAPPKDVMEQVTKPVEKAVAGIQGIKNLTSTSNDSVSTVVIELEQGIKPEDTKRDIESLLANVKLPQGAEKPRAETFGMASVPVYYLSVYGKNGMSQQELDKIFKDVINPGFTGMKGVDHVDSIGNQESVLTMKLNANAINNYNLTPAQVSQSIQASLASVPAGAVEFNGNSQLVRVKSDLNAIYNLENMKLMSAGGDTVLLKDVAKIEAITESTFLSRLNGHPAIGVRLFKTKSANAVEFGKAADKLMDGWRVDYPNIEFQAIYNGAVDIQNSINGMVKEGALGAVLASVMILLFLRNVRMTLIVLVSIPLSTLITLMIMAPLGITLNIMTLGGLAIAIGRVVDDSIVVIENIYSQLQKAQERNESVIALATAQVASAITSSTLTTVGVFAPIGFVSGMMGDVFRPFAITLVVALLSSLIVAVTVIPMLAKILVLRSKNIKTHDEHEVGRLARTYKNVLVWSLDNRIKVIILSIILFLGSVAGTVPFLAKTFMPESESDKMMSFDIKMPRDTTMQMMNEKSKEIEAMFFEAKDKAGQPAFEYIEASIGYNNEKDRVPYRSSFFGVASAATNARDAVEEYKAKIAYLLPQGSEVNGSVLSFGGGGGSGPDFSYVLKGDDINSLKKAAEAVRTKLKEFPELVDVKDSLSESKTQVEINVDQNKARLYGLTSAQIAEGVQSWLAESKIGDLKFDNTTFKTKVLLDPAFKNSIDKIGRFTLTTPTNAKVALNEVAKLQQVDAPVEISREMQEQNVRVTAKINSDDKGGISTKVSEALKTVELPNDVRAQVKGVTTDIDESFQQMFLAMIASIFIVFLVMVLAFGNAAAPFAILFSLPLAAIGGLLALLITNESLNITSLIGFLMLIGVVVTNAIVLIDRVQQLREEGHPIHESLIEAGLTRLRPIIMTAGATIIALLPLALGFSKGALISKGLAVVVIGGLTTSTILTLVVVPVAYDIIEGIKRRVGRLFNRKDKAALEAPATH